MLVPALRKNGRRGEISCSDSIFEVRASNTRAGGVARRFREVALLQADFQPFSRVTINVDCLRQRRAGGIEGTKRKLLLGLLAQSRNLGIRGFQRLEIVADLDEVLRRPSKPLLSCIGFAWAGLCLAREQCAIKRRERYVTRRRDALDLRSRIIVDFRHGEQQPVALRQRLALDIGEDEIGQRVLDIGQLAPAGALVDFHLHELHHRAEFKPGLAQMRDQCRRERAIRAVTVGRSRAGRRSKAIDRPVGAADTTQAKLDRARRCFSFRRVVRTFLDDRSAAASTCRPGLSEGIVAAGVEQNNSLWSDFGDPDKNPLERKRRSFQRGGRVRLGIGRQEKVAAGSLHAVAREKDEGKVRALVLFHEFVERRRQAAVVAVGFDDDLEAESLQRRLHRARVRYRIGELSRRGVVPDADHESDALFQCALGRRFTGRGERKGHHRYAAQCGEK